MSNIKLIKDPGYIYDLNFLFCYKFNAAVYTKAFTDEDKKKEFEKELNYILSGFGEIPKDLYVFFHANSSGRAFLPSCYFYPYQKHFLDTYDFKFLLKELVDQTRLVRNLIKFCFCDFDEETINQCVDSLPYLFSCIKKSEYSEEEKNRLYEFFMDPASYIQLLQYELMEKEVKLSEYYKNNYQKILDVYNQTTFESLKKQLKEYDGINIDCSNDISGVSYCLLYKYCVCLGVLPNSALPILGYDYKYMLDCNKDDSKEYSLYDLGVAVGDESRIKIFNFILARGEIICKDLEKEFSFSGSTAYHHITIMVRSGVIKTRNEGKMIYYSINKENLSTIIGVLKKIVDKKGL